MGVIYVNITTDLAQCIYPYDVILLLLNGLVVCQMGLECVVVHVVVIQ